MTRQERRLQNAVRRELSLPAAIRRRLPRRLPFLATLLLGLGAGPLAAQVSYRQEMLPGFFSSLDAGDDSAPELADLGGDGDLDLVVGNRAGRLQLFENTGAATAPAFAELRGVENPFTGIDVGDSAQPALADLDGDGDLDALVGNAQGLLRCFSNIGTSSVPAFLERTGSANPFAGVDAGDYSAPELADLDGDGDLDAVVGTSASRPRYFVNTGSAAVPAFVQRTGSANPFPATGGSRLDPQLEDIDDDGDLDLALGSEGGAVSYYKNTGSSNAPLFLSQFGINDPFFGANVGNLSSPAFGDLDGDGDPDALLGESYGSLHYLDHLSEGVVPFFHDLTDEANPVFGAGVGELSSPALTDLDADGDLDAVVGSRFGTVSYFENTGSPAAAAFVGRPASANPFDDVGVGHSTTPELADLDGDGDLDLVLGEEDGALNYFKNTGSPAVPAFESAFKENPFLGVYVGGFTSAELADLDADGDLDALLGRQASSLVYFENTGNATSPAFIERTGSADPFAAVDTGGLGIPVLGDVDGDHDLDLVLGDRQLYFENTGSRQAPIFTQRTGGGNPFDGADLGSFGSPELGDLDGDGDLDALFGEDGGQLVFFREWRALVFADGFESGDTTFWSLTVP